VQSRLSRGSYLCKARGTGRSKKKLRRQIQKSLLSKGMKQRGNLGMDERVEWDKGEGLIRLGACEMEIQTQKM